MVKPDDQLSTNPKQVRNRARRAQKKAEKELANRYKPIEEWDDEELARGRPRNKSGGFQGAAPKWVTRQVHEEALRRFTERTRTEMRTLVGSSLMLLQKIIENDDYVYDEEGEPVKPVISASTKLDAAKFLLEQVLGKPKQQIEGDLTLQIQQILAGSVVNTDDIIELNGQEENEEDDEDEEDDEE